MKRAGLPVKRAGLPVKRAGLPVKRAGLPVKWLMLALCLSAGQALAQDADALGGTTSDRRTVESAQDAATEVRFGPYEPNVDDDLAGTPYRTSFGTKRRWLFALEVDWQLLRIPHVGTLSPALQVGYVRINGKAPFSDGSGVSEQPQRLWILPIHGLGVLRVDVLARDYKVPLVPYVKAGLSYAFWSCSTGETRCEDANGIVGRGAEYGYHAAAGLMLLLDALDPVSASDMDNSTGINNSYFFAEYYNSDIDSFGSGLQVGADTWTLGLAFEH